MFSIALITAWLAASPLAPLPFNACPDSAGFWDNTTIATPYRENISDVEKIAGLSRLWAEAKFNFSGFERVPELNWDSVYVAYLDKVATARSTLEYYQILQSMCALLHDGHTRVWPPIELVPQLFATPDIETQSLGDTVLITSVLNSELLASGLQEGMQICDIDGLPIHEYAKARVLPYLSASTPQQRESLCYSWALLQGSISDTVTISTKNANGECGHFRLPRRYSRLRPPEMDYHMLPDSIVYIEVREFRSDSLQCDFNILVRKLQGTRGCVLDLRRNAGGYIGPMHALLSFFLDTAIVLDHLRSRLYSPHLRHWGGPQVWSTDSSAISPTVIDRYLKPLVLLAGPLTASAAEGFALALQTSGRANVVGRQTAGSTGQTLTIALPGGIHGRIEFDKVALSGSSGSDWLGVVPDIRVDPTVDEFRQHRDVALETAVQWLTEGNFDSRR
jgi:carboxyl-terminal processing protease